ncbi:DUF4446 family protein [Carboxydothermus ferrireducens]|uniref:DUF4446 domain-containing protein n=1 Tax=Carboxydothermus ferrireducens DSM 11255 TaxID=1119529 RepID=A0ABX2RBZ1_9THEO|nr:DUF4446 family protein [Carboxydothermus ferrireducens]NYE57583.1 hypothetical protein [Carboxydothermus ferrireducens DSM 11255]
MLNFTAVMRPEVILGAFGLNLIFFLLLLNLYIKTVKLRRELKDLLKGNSGQNLENILLDLARDNEVLKGEVTNLKKYTEDLNQRLLLAVQKVGMVRYKALPDLGSELSFSVAFLDANNNGVVITSLYGREQCLVYGKPVERGISTYPLTEEEQKAIRKAMEEGR